MTRLIVLPASTYDRYKTDGVQFSKLCDTNYITEVSSVTDLAEMQDAHDNFTIEFCSVLDVCLAEPPLALLAKSAATLDAYQAKWRELHNRLEGRMQSLHLRQGTSARTIRSYTLYPVDENLWVAVQQRLHDVIGDPSRLSVKVNRDFFDSVIGELLRNRSFELVAATKIFTNYLESQRVD
jgi:hypothetical protein